MKYWINTVSKDHVMAGVEGGFTQADHGKDTRLKKLAPGDYIVFYSPRTEYKGGEILRSFTAIGQIIDETPYRVKMKPGFEPWRRQVNFIECRETGIRDLIISLSFIKNKEKWGFPFRRGLFEIPRSDMEIIAHAMGVKLAGQ